MEKVDLIPPSIKHLQFHRFLKNGNDLFCQTKTLKREWHVQLFVASEISFYLTLIFPFAFKLTLLLLNV